uniref:G_PROTEIN_RECEP_F1_2 domain-containing protein n=1 Tax=Syphacia muris TaxID=451379 RepID=A0A158R5U9_9BILA
MLRHRSSHYFYYLTSVLVADILMLVELTFRLISDFVPSLRGFCPTMCKVTATTANVTACFVNWTWVLMFVQRFVYVFFPMKTVHANGGCIDIISNAKVTLTGTAEVFKWITIADAIWTYALPLTVTTITDLTGNTRRHRAIRRCLIMATLQLLLTVPNYAVQLADGIFHLQDGSTTAVAYLYLDAFCYILYLFQFPLLAAYVYCFIKIQHKDIIIRTILQIISVINFVLHAIITSILWLFQR